MCVEYTEHGYWLATIRLNDRLILAEGNTRDEAVKSGMQMVFDRVGNNIGGGKNA